MIKYIYYIYIYQILDTIVEINDTHSDSKTNCIQNCLQNLCITKPIYQGRRYLTSTDTPIPRPDSLKLNNIERFTGRPSQTTTTPGSAKIEKGFPFVYDSLPAFYAPRGSECNNTLSVQNTSVFHTPENSFRRPYRTAQNSLEDHPRTFLTAQNSLDAHYRRSTYLR